MCEKIFIAFSLFIFAQTAMCDSETDLIVSLANYLPFGIHKGKDSLGKKCLIEVTNGESLPVSQIHKSVYQIEIFTHAKHGWYGWTDFSAHAGGFGDCPQVVYDTGSYLEIRNGGSSFPCMSSSKKSNRKGLKIVVLQPSLKDVITLDESGNLETKCTIED